MTGEPDYTWWTTKARCCLCGGALSHEGGLGIHPPHLQDPKRLTCSPQVSDEEWQRQNSERRINHGNR